MKLMANQCMRDQCKASQCKAVGKTVTSYQVLFSRMYHAFDIEWFQFFSVQFGMKKQNFEHLKPQELQLIMLGKTSNSIKLFIHSKLH